jgi:hypothetical protein
MLHFMAAVTPADSDVTGRVYNAGRALIIKDLNGISPRESRLMHKYPANLSFPGGKEILYKILFHIQISVQKLGKIFLIDVGANAHKGKFDKAGHGRGQHIEGPAVALKINQQAPVSQIIKPQARFMLRHVPYAGDFFYRERTYRGKRDEVGVLFGKQYFQDLKKKLRGRSALGKAVEPFH